MPLGQESRRNDPAGLTHVHHFYTRRNLWTHAALRERVPSLLHLQTLLGGYTVGLKTARFLPLRWINKDTGPLKPHTTGTLYVPSLSGEQSWLEIFESRARAVSRSLYQPFKGDDVMVASTSSSTSAESLPEDRIDYIFTDPPFGGNLFYSELSFINEAWLGAITNPKLEVVANKAQGKGLADYQALMTECFRSYYKVLRPGRWMTVEFHNSANEVWNAIHESLEKVGFVVADVRVIDKQQYSFKQVTTSGATKQDLVISCYKPTERFTRLFAEAKGTTAGVQEFVDEHLSMLPVAPINASGHLEQLAERTLGVLYDRMIAYHLVQGARIPMSATEFAALLKEGFFEEDGMWFLPSQLAEYQARKMRGAEVEQLSIFVQDEKSAVRWVRSELEDEPQTQGELTPKFMKALTNEWPDREPRPELKDLLAEYFIKDGDGTWMVPDPENEQHLLTLRRNQLLKLFSGYLKEPKTLKSFRKEAMLEGLKECWQRKLYGQIVRACEKIKPADLQADRELMQFYDIAKDLTPEDGAGQMEFVLE